MVARNTPLRIKPRIWAIVINGIRWEFDSLAQIHQWINNDPNVEKTLNNVREIRLFLNNRQIYRGPWGEGIA